MRFVLQNGGFSFIKQTKIMTPNPPYIFLLGGHDLEMAEIRIMFSELKIEFYDQNLGWGQYRHANFKNLKL